MTTTNLLLMPDGNQRITERLGFLSAVPISRNGHEPVRASLRAYPRTTLTGTFYLYADEHAAVMAAMRNEDEFLIPHWPHVARVGVAGFESGLQFPGDGSPQQAVLFGPGAPALYDITTNVSGGVLIDSTFNGGVMPDGGGAAYPLVRARIEGERGFEWLTKGLARVSLTFGLLDFDEVVPAYDGPTSYASLPLLANADGSQNITDRAIVAENRVDVGHLVLVARKYQKRNVSVLLRFNTREQILTFRSLCISLLKGQVGLLRYQVPGDSVERTWRLGQDDIELAWWRAGLAECTLTLIEVD